MDIHIHTCACIHTPQQGLPVWHLTGVCSSGNYVHIIPEIRAPCHHPPQAQSPAMVRLSCCRGILLLVIWALRCCQCGQGSGRMDVHMSGKNAAPAPAPWALSRWAEMLALRPGPMCCCRPFVAGGGSSYKLISLQTPPCLDGLPVCLAC